MSEPIYVYSWLEEKVFTDKNLVNPTCEHVK